MANPICPHCQRQMVVPNPQFCPFCGQQFALQSATAQVDLEANPYAEIPPERPLPKPMSFPMLNRSTPTTALVLNRSLGPNFKTTWTRAAGITAGIMVRSRRGRGHPGAQPAIPQPLGGPVVVDVDHRRCLGLDVHATPQLYVLHAIHAVAHHHGTHGRRHRVLVFAASPLSGVRAMGLGQDGTAECDILHRLHGFAGCFQRIWLHGAWFHA